MKSGSELKFIKYKKRLKSEGFKFSWEGKLKSKTSSVELQHSIKKMIADVSD